MRAKVEEMNQYFSKKIAECSNQKSVLLVDDRRDEANFWQIRANIYDIFKTILSVGERTQKTEEAVKQFFLKKLSEMISTWKESGQRAAANSAEEKAQIEAIKVEAAKEIRGVFEQIWGEKDDGN